MTARMLGRRAAHRFQLAALGVVFAAFLIPSQAGADVFCDYVDAGEPGAAGNVLAVTVVGELPDFGEGFNALTRIKVARSDGAIKIRAPEGPMSCEGQRPTATNIDSIRIAASSEQVVMLDLAGGPLAPGATDEGDQSSEIEVTFVGEYSYLLVRGGPGPNRMVAGPTEEDDQLGVNLNPRLDRGDGDADVRVSEEAEMALLGGRGPDSLLFDAPEDQERRHERFIYMGGGAGNDVLRSDRPGLLAGGAGDDLLRGGPTSFSLMLGRGGDDVLLGGGGRDFLIGGNGRDELRSGAGRDILFARDGRADRIDCGPGKDGLASFDLEDGRRSCEKRRRGRRGDDPFSIVVESETATASPGRVVRTLGRVRARLPR